MTFKKITTPSLKEVFIQEIENMILSGELKIGDKLPPERELVETMGISLSVITAGIADLENKGFVEIRPRQGIFVSDYIHKGSLETLVSIMRYNNGKLNSREVKSMVETRIVLEQLTVRDVIERGTDEDLKALESYFNILKKEKDAEEAANIVLDFFHAMSILSDNILLPLLYHSFRAPMVGMYKRFAEQNGIEPIFETAYTLYQLVLARDTEGAEAWVESYLKKVVIGDTAIIYMLD